ncbi:hypothetical protein ACMYR3_04050 [Ampullimonas aquatilis]|uniref:hypothetical protein n=1 Tax=Ampullimonas aquatilis TaxID=1341549 RepID=UPI003C78B03A
MESGVADFDMAVLGQGLPAHVEALIAEAGKHRSQPEIALPLLLQANQLAPDHPATLIGLYRFHFYGHELDKARETAKRSLSLGAKMLGLPPRWQDVELMPLPGARFDAATRFYLFALKGFAYLSLRLGEMEIGKEALDVLAELDPDNRVGARVLEEVLARVGKDDYSDEPV